MRYLLNLCYLLFLVVVSPILMYRVLVLKKYRNGFREKFFGFVPKLPPCEKGHVRVWFHAVSVGEMNLLVPIVKLVVAEHADWEIVISTTSKTGMELGRKKFPQYPVFYAPIDFSWSTNTAMRRIAPNLLVLVELELWPNLILAAKRFGTRVAIVNGRISEKSLKRYRHIRFLTRFLFSRIDCIAAQDGYACDAFRQLGAEQTVLTGAIKFDGVEMNRRNEKTLRLAALAGVREGDLVFLAGSTQSPEEAMALTTFKILQSDYPELKLILVPRHPERFEEVARLLAASSFPWQRRSHLNENDTPRAENRILLVDTVGELGAWWGVCEIAFVGGSMTRRGGQNMLEPAAYGAAVSFGPNTKNFRDISSMMLKANAARVVMNQEEMTAFVRECLEYRAKAVAMGTRARDLVLTQQGATKKTLHYLEKLV
ncbi:MAG: 3-deoxy-D-manno-octulosonic acid transferase [Planctomycetia bacterium]|nr:3-deoxy-D-manno-octulosonic acid transferase [Planctomycetia bacterium]